MSHLEVENGPSTSVHVYADNASDNSSGWYPRFFSAPAIIASAAAVDTSSTPLSGTMNDNNNKEHGPISDTAVTSRKQTVGDYHPLSIDDAMELLGMGFFQYQILWAAGLCFMADAMEVLLLSFLAVILRNEWQLSEREMNTIISVVFAGALLGTLILTPLGDMVGRQPMFRITAAMIAIFGIATAFCTSYTQLLWMRFFVGFGVGGLTVPFDTLSEFLPTGSRGRNLLYIEFFWTLGTLSVPLLAYISLEGGDRNQGEDDVNTANWPLFVILCSIPCIVSTILGMILVPESPRWLLEQGYHERALQIMKHAAERNGKNADELFPPGTYLIDTYHYSHPHPAHDLPPHIKAPDDVDKTAVACEKAKEDVVASEREQQFPMAPQPLDSNVSTTGLGLLHKCCHPTFIEHFDCTSFLELFSPTWKYITLLLWGAWFGLGFLYYGVVLAVSIVFTANDNPAAGDNNDDTNAEMAYEFDYSAIFISASSEIFGLLAVLWTIDRYGRIISQTSAYWIGGATCFALGLCSAYLGGPRWALIALAFVARMAMMGASCTTWVSTSEILSTDIRATGHGAANAMARIGGFICPHFITQANSMAFIGILLLVVAAGTAECSRRLPETAGITMGGYGDKDDKNKGIDIVMGTVSEESATINGTKNTKTKRGMARRETLERKSSVSSEAGLQKDEPTTSYHQVL